MGENDVWTIKAALDWTVGYLARKGDENPRLSAEWLLAEACGMRRIELYVNFERPLSTDERDVLRGYVSRRGKGEPLQYITGEVAFRHIAVKVRKDVLIPRPETEVLVSEALALLPAPERACALDSRITEEEAAALAACALVVRTAAPRENPPASATPRENPPASAAPRENPPVPPNAFPTAPVPSNPIAIGSVAPSGATALPISSGAFENVSRETLGDAPADFSVGTPDKNVSRETFVPLSYDITTSVSRETFSYSARKTAADSVGGSGGLGNVSCETQDAAPSSFSVDSPDGNVSCETFSNDRLEEDAAGEKDRLRKERLQKGCLLVADICTGSGCIACSIAYEHPLAHVIATDIAPEAVALARENVSALGLTGRVRVLEGDLGACVPQELMGTFDLVVSNPPYVPTAQLAEIPREVTDFEPAGALDGGSDGLDVFRRLLAWCTRALKPGGAFAIELHETCLNAAAVFAEEAGFANVRITRDLAGRPRVLSGKRR